MIVVVAVTIIGKDSSGDKSGDYVASDVDSHGCNHSIVGGGGGSNDDNNHVGGDSGSHGSGHDNCGRNCYDGGRGDDKFEMF